jgi:hypothetical protein
VGAAGYYWIAFYRFPEKIGHVKYDEEKSLLLQKWENIAVSSNWWYPYESVVFVCDRPVVKKNERGLLHCDNGPAILYPDTYAQYYLNGRVVPDWLACKDKKDITVESVLEIENAEVRAQGIRKIGIDQVIDKAEIIESSENGYVLLDMAKILGLNSKAPYLKMVNPSNGEIHVEGVHPDCKTVRQSLNWRATGDINKDWNPEILT